MPAKFTVRQRPNDGYQFVLVATNGRVLASSENYETRRAVLSAIESVRKNAPAAQVVDETAEPAAAAKKTPARKATGRKATGRKAAAGKTPARKAAAGRSSTARTPRKRAAKASS